MTQGSTVGDVIASLKDAGVSANFDETNHRIFISSKDTGKDNDFTLTGGNTEGARALYQMGLAVVRMQQSNIQVLHAVLWYRWHTNRAECSGCYQKNTRMRRNHIRQHLHRIQILHLHMDMQQHIQR